MQIPFTDSKGNAHLFRLAPGPITEDGDTTPIPSALDGLDKYDQYRLGLLVEAALDQATALAPGAGEDE